MIIITGPKHCGKTVVGRTLQTLMAYKFTDLDEFIEKQTGKNVREIFKCGADVFRNEELSALKTILDIYENEPQLIVSAGGGIIDNDSAMELLSRRLKPGNHQLKNKISFVYLEVSAETAWERIVEKSKELGTLPPFLDTENPKETHRLLHNRRAQLYKKCAELIVDCENKSVNLIAGEIKKFLLMMNER
ncbi:MAG: shikimate kinase [Termitinemataceae bacterium]|nr:MAG: shikimate kinase [Termitinemataceae bacterium]